MALGVPALLVGALALILIVGLPGSGGVIRAAGEAGSRGEPYVYSDDSVPAQNVTMIGSSPQDPSVPSNENETWGIGEVGDSESSWAIVRYTSASGWTLAPNPLDAAGQPLSEFRPESSSPLTGEMSPAGSGVLVGTAPKEPESSARSQVVLVRSAGEAFRETEAVPPALLQPEGQIKQELFNSRRAPLIAALDEGAHAGALVVPVSPQASGIETGVLYWDGNTRKWTREEIEVPGGAQEGFHVLAIGASSPSNAWLLAQLSSSSSEVALFRRQLGEGGEPATWQAVAPVAGGEPGEPLTIGAQPKKPGGPFVIPGAPDKVRAQILTVTSEGVWIDGERPNVLASTTLFFKPDGQKDSGEVTATWCNAEGSEPCKYKLPLLGSEPIVNGPSRSFAWAGPSPYGQRVITGLPEGVSLRLEGSEFKRVLSLGGSESPGDVGGTHGAAFSSPLEGWLGNELLPVHLSSTAPPERLKPYPVPFRHALTAIAPQPGVPIGALSSQVLAVGDQGEVARYIPEVGWKPESLLSANGTPATPRLRGVAWPTPSRAYAVGEGQMWLWRAETGLWEPDPATPVDFHGSLLGIAFEPGNPTRGYAVGQPGVAGEPGVLLRYGKTWTQEAVPAEVAGASFTSVAFAGSEVIVAFRLEHIVGGQSGYTASYTGGLLVNEGSGWHVDQSAGEALGSGGVPWAVAGLPDGGAAASAIGERGEPVVIERNAPGSPWQRTSTPYPGTQVPGSLALFRENGSLRVIGSGAVPNTQSVDDKLPPPAGFPANELEPYPLALQEGTGPVLRQTATGWKDEEQDEKHDFIPVGEPPGEYKLYDMVNQPDPISAVLVSPSGEQGWAIGGVSNPGDSTGLHDTADVARYPAEPGVEPPGVEHVPVHLEGNEARFAIGGNAACQAPCANRENADLGPDAWLSSALKLASPEKIAGIRAFVYTGPRVTSGFGHGTVPVPYAHEFSRYASLLGSSPVPAFAAPSPTDREGAIAEGNARSECSYEEAFAAFPQPFGNGSPASGISPAGPEVQHEANGEWCSAGKEPGYYAFTSTGSPGPKVRVIVLEDGSEVGNTQLTWLETELEEAKGATEPAIVIGNGDLGSEIAAGNQNATHVAEALEARDAAAYFYDSPEVSVEGELGKVPTFGSGTLGYIKGTPPESKNFEGQSGILLVQVPEPTAPNEHVKVELIPDIEELALEAKDGVLLQRSHDALFTALARRPRAGGISPRGEVRSESFDYIPLGVPCPLCSNRIEPQFTFRSSAPKIGAFIKDDISTAEPTPLLNASGEVESDENPGEGRSPLFCAFNAGETTVSIEAGGLKSSMKVTIEAGSVRRPCGTTPLNLPASSQAPTPVPAPAPPPAPAPAPAPASALPLLPPPPLLPAPPAPPRAAPPPVPPAFFVLVAPVTPVPAFVPLPVPSPARPTPPSGTSAVTSPIEVAEHQEEEEEATESVSNQASAYSAPDHEPSPVYVLGIVVLAAFAGASVRRRPRGGRRGARIAPATITTMRTQRRMGEDRRRPW